MPAPASLKILVCVRQVPDVEGSFRPDPAGVALDESGLVYRMSEVDRYAVEEAARWKERYGVRRVTALSVGPERAGAVVRRALEFGLDHGAHIRTEAGEPDDALNTAERIAAYARQHDFSLLLFGVMSEDLQRFQTGPMTAALLGIPHASAVISAELTPDGGRVRAEQEVEGGRREILELFLPALLAVQPGINTPRYPSLSHKLRARNQALEVLPAGPPLERGAVPCRTSLRAPTLAHPGVYLSGTPEEKAEQLVRLIRQKTGLL